MEIPDGGHVGIIGGGPAGALAGYFLLEMAGRAGLELHVDIFEPRDFSASGPGGCNMCGGIISESLVQLLATDGINLPEGVVQRGISSYVLHCDGESVELTANVKENRIAALHRGKGPRGCKDDTILSADGYLLELACKKGARHFHDRVISLNRDTDGRMVVQTRDGTCGVYDLIVGATGVNASSLKLFEGLDIGYCPPKTAKTFICEVLLGRDLVRAHLGNAMHVFLLDLPGLEFAAAIPKGEYVTLCMLGDGLDDSAVERFMTSPEVRSCVPFDWTREKPSCKCSPRLNMGGTKHYFGDRIVLIGDCGISRLYKDGIGAAYRTAKACAVTAVFRGVGENDFSRFFKTRCRHIERDNQLGKMIFRSAILFRKIPFLRHGMLHTIRQEQTSTSERRPMSQVMWNTFTGSAPYQEIVARSLMPDFWFSFGRGCFHALAGTNPRHRTSEKPKDTGV